MSENFQFIYDHVVLKFHFVKVFYYIDSCMLNPPFSPGISPIWSWYMIILMCYWIATSFLPVTSAKTLFPDKSTFLFLGGHEFWETLVNPVYNPRHFLILLIPGLFGWDPPPLYELCVTVCDFILPDF